MFRPNDLTSYFIEYGNYEHILKVAPTQVAVSLARETQMRLVLTSLLVLALQVINASVLNIVFILNMESKNSFNV